MSFDKNTEIIGKEQREMKILENAPQTFILLDIFY